MTDGAARPTPMTPPRRSRGLDRGRAAPVLARYAATIPRRVQRLTTIVLAGLAAAAVGGCGIADPDRTDVRPGDELTAPDSDSWTLVGVDVLPMTSDTLFREQTLVVRDGRIVAMGARAEVEAPADLEIVDGSGRVVLPGLADMHVHLRSTADMDRLLDAGVTFVRNMWGTTTTQALIELVESGERPGPRIASVSTGIDGSPPTHTPSEVLVDPTDAEEIVDRQLAAGWTTLKVYQGLSLEGYQALADAARERDVSLVGHVPTGVPLEIALTDMRSIEHLEGYDKALNGGVRERAFRAWTHIDVEGMGTLAAATAKADTWISPTLLVAARMLRRNLPAADAERAIRMRGEMVRHLAGAGVPLLAGTDAGVPIVEPGPSLHEELELLVDAGLDRFRVLRSATADAARFLGWDEELGTVVPGLRADLLVAPSDPRDDLTVLRAPRAVIIDGRWVRSAVGIRRRHRP